MNKLRFYDVVLCSYPEENVPSAEIHLSIATDRKIDGTQDEILDGLKKSCERPDVLSIEEWDSSMKLFSEVILLPEGEVTMSKNEFAEYIKDTYSVDRANLAFIENAIEYVRSLYLADKEAQQDVLHALLDGTIGLEEWEFMLIDPNKEDQE